MNLYFCRYDSPSVRVTSFYVANDDDEAAIRLADDVMGNGIVIPIDDVEVTHIDVVDGYKVTVE